MTIRAKLLALLAVFILMTSLIISFMAYRSYKDSLALTATDGKALAISLANYVAAFMKTAAEYEQMVSSMPVIARGAGHLPTNLNPDTPYSLKGLSPEAADLLAAMKRAKDASPVNFVNPGMCPMQILHGNSDPIVPIEASSDILYQKICDAGLEDRADYYVVEHAGHGTREFFQDSMKELMISFFDKHLKN